MNLHYIWKNGNAKQYFTDMYACKSKSYIKRE